MIDVYFIRGHFSLEERNYQKLYSKGFGEKVGKLFLLNIYEVLFLIEKEKVEVFDSKRNKLSEKEIRKNKEFNLNRYLVFSDLKKKGYLVKSALKYGFDFRIYDKGIRKESETHSLWLLKIIKDTEKINITDLSSKARVAHSTKKKILFAVVDSQFDVTYYENSWTKI